MDTMKKFLYSLMALPMLFVACGEGHDAPVEEPKKPTLELKSAETMEFEAEGGEGVISFAYNIKGGIDDFESPNSSVKVIDVACDAAWIDAPSSVETFAGSFRFTVAKNENEEPREATITASLNEYSFVVTVKQATAENGGNNDDEPEFVEGWAINGTMNDWVKKDAAAMTEEGDYFVVKGFELAADDNFNFIFNGTEKCYGGNGQVSEPDYTYDAKSWGSNIHVSKTGTYDIYLNKGLDKYYIMSEGVDPSEAQVAIKPGEVSWSIYGDIAGYNNVDIVLNKVGKYLEVKNVQFDGDKSFVVRCNGGDKAVLGVASADACNIEDSITLVADYVSEIKMNPVVWKSVTGGYMPHYNNFVIGFVTEDIELVLDFTAGVDVVNYVIPAGVYYLDDKDDTGFCFDLEYCAVKVRGFDSVLMDGTMTIAHVNGVYDIFVDMRTAQLDVIKLHYVGEVHYDSYFNMMGGLEINNPAN